MNIGNAIEFVKMGEKLFRNNWSGKGMYIQLFSKTDFSMKQENEEIYDHILDDEDDNPVHHLGVDDKDGFYQLQDFIVLKTSMNKIAPWVPSQEDLLAEDWELDNYE